MPDNSTRSLLLESGEVDIALRLPPTEIERFNGSSEVSTDLSDTIMTMYVALNEHKGNDKNAKATGPLTDVRVRQAMNYAIDKQAIVNDILGGLGTVADAPISPLTWGYDSIGAYPYDLEKSEGVIKRKPATPTVSILRSGLLPADI